MREPSRSSISGRTQGRIESRSSSVVVTRRFMKLFSTLKALCKLKRIFQESTSHCYQWELQMHSITQNSHLKEPKIFAKHLTQGCSEDSQLWTRRHAATCYHYPPCARISQVRLLPSPDLQFTMRRGRSPQVSFPSSSSRLVRQKQYH